MTSIQSVLQRLSKVLEASTRGGEIPSGRIEELAGELDRLDSPSSRFHAREILFFKADRPGLERELAITIARLDLEQQLTEIIRSRLRSGAVTCERSHFLDQHGVAFSFGTGPAGDCGACGEPIRKEVYSTLSPGLLLHEFCERIWERERHRPAE